MRVRTEKLDALVNQVGELVITQAMMAQLGGALDPVRDEKLLAGLAQLERQTRHLQEAVMATRMLPIASVFARFPRLVHDLSERLGKPARLVTSGDDTELDRSVIEKIADPLTHLLRNALDHGLESPEGRRAAGKAETGTIRLAAEQRSGHILVTVADDGRGLDRARILAKARERGLPVSDAMSDNEVWTLVYQPGFSTSETVTELSGRGVGMDVVRRNVQDLGGDIELASTAGAGTRVTIRLPLTLAIVDGMLVRAGGEIFIVPLSAIVESLQPTPGQTHAIGRFGRVVRVHGEQVPLVTLGELLNVPHGGAADREVLVVVESGGQRLALQVDELVGQQQVVIKSLAANYRHVRFISGATILGDGRVCLILDVGELVRGIGEPAAA
ncbi:MAG TPA: chemotaxis protein CheA [Burkholderiaceae bacterium]